MKRHAKARLLIVDDEYFNYSLYKSLLAQQYELYYSESGRQCLEQVLDDKPDAIMLDVCMPGLDGYDTCRLLKNNPLTRDIPILMVSGLDGKKAVQQGLKVGADAYFSKPLKPNELLDSLQVLLFHDSE